MCMKDTDFLPTRRSLLSRLKNWNDQASWKEFFDTYGRLIYRVATKAGLNDAEAQDVVQETVIVVARKIPAFKYDPALGSFKSWLLLITRRRIEKQLKKRMPLQVKQTASYAVDVNEPNHTATVERVPDPKSFDLGAEWDAEWKNNLWAVALARVKAHF